MASRSVNRFSTATNTIEAAINVSMSGGNQRAPGASLKAVWHGGAPCPHGVKKAMIEWWGPVVTEYYGGTEGAIVSLISADDWLRKPDSVGKPVGTDFRLGFATLPLILALENGDPSRSAPVIDCFSRGEV